MDVDTALNRLGSLKLNPNLQGEILQAASSMNMLLGSADDVAEAMIRLNAQESSQNFKNTQEELSSLDSRYQANQKRITELNALKSNGTITASGRSELEMLEKENIALKTQINSKNTLQDMEQQKETGIYRKCIPSDRYLSLFNRDSWLIRNPLTIICSTCITLSKQPERRNSIE
jgi:hypothetical protein